MVKKENISEIIEKSLSKNAIEIMKFLESNNFDAYAVGGCVRDFLLGKPCHDEDIATNAKPEEVVSMFRNNGYNVVETGLKHGTVTVFPKGSKEGFEITTFRSDGDYSDGRRPDSVQFEESIEEDLKRRDFTINAMAYSLSKGFVSASSVDSQGIIHDGIQDLNDGIIRAVGNANDRIQEDSLRMMRAIRFAAKFEYELDESLIEAIKLNAHDIQRVSAERIDAEFVKLLSTKNLDYITTMHEVGLLKEILPELDNCYGFDQFNNWHKYDLYNHTLEAAKKVDSIEEIEALLLHDIGKIKAQTFSISGTTPSFENIEENLSKEGIKLLNIFKESRKEEDLLALKTQMELDGINTKKMRYLTVDRDGESLVSSKYQGHSLISKEMSEIILKRFKKSNIETKKVLDLIEHHDFIMGFQANDSEKQIKQKITTFFIEHQDLANKEFMDSLFRIIAADHSSQNEEMYLKTNRNELEDKVKEQVYSILEGPHLLSDLNINGNELMELGFKGKEIQVEKFKLLEYVMNGNIENDYESLAMLAFKHVSKVHKDYLSSIDFEKLNELHNGIGDKMLDSLIYVDKYYFSSNENLTERLIEKYEDNIDWTALTSMLNASKNPNSKDILNLEFIQRNEEKIDFAEISNLNLRDISKIIEKYSDKLDWGNIFSKDRETAIKLVQEIDNEEVYTNIRNFEPKDFIPNELSSKKIEIGD